nr:Imm3 family immunity protein [Brevibacillus sp. HB1.2]
MGGHKVKRNYEALFGAFYENYFYFKSERMSGPEALACTCEAYFGMDKRGEMEKAVLFIAEGRIHLTHSKIFVKSKQKIIDALNSLDLNKLQLEIAPDDYQDILERRDMVLDGIESIPVDYSPNTRYYYFEIDKEVKNYFGILFNEKKDAIELVEEIMERFERECRSTLSEKIVVRTTLAELLIRYRINAKGEFLKIKNELEQFDMNDVGEQLSENEKLDLSMRIREVLSKLQNL